jgi:tight adherence protein C
MSPLLLLSLIGTFVAVALVTGSATYLVLARLAPGRRRLHAAVSATQVTTVAGPTTLANQASPLIERIASFVPKSPKEMTKLRRRLMRAGYHSLNAAVVFSMSELLLPVVGAAIPILWLGLPTGALFAIGGAVIGFLIPSFVLARMIEKRRKAISNGLPDALDLLCVCLEAGSSLDQALVRATEELAIAHPALTEELKMLSAETRAGKPRIEAFKNLEARTKNDDIRALVAMLVQTDRFGTSVAQSLRTFADVSRTKRRQGAEERAAKVGVKLVFPLVLCLFPALYVVTLGPAVVQIVRVFFGQVVN